jgi:monoamine oxidase
MRKNPADPSGHGLKRRQVLQIAASSALALAVGSGPAGCSSDSSSNGKSKRVVVIGGGIGGLSCAFELMERGHQVTVLEASARTGGHVKTIRDPLPDGLYADVGAEHFTNPGYDQYRKYVRKFDLPVLPWARRQNMYRKIDGKWYTESELADPNVLRDFGFNSREVDYIVAHGWTELSTLYLAPYIAKFTDEYQPFGVGVDDLDHQLLGDVLADAGLSKAATRFIGGAASRLAGRTDVPEPSALFRIWQMAIPKMRGLPNFKREVFHLKGGNQLLPDTLAAKLGARVLKNTQVTALEHDDKSVTIHFKQNDADHSATADYAVLCVSPLVMPKIDIKPAWPVDKSFALQNTPMGMQSRVLLVTRGRFWEGDVPSINLETGEPKMSLVYETAADVAGERRVLMGSGLPAQAPEETLAAFRKFYPGHQKDTIEQCIVHEWWKQEPLALGCERHPWPFGKLKQIWPHIIQPVGRIYFAGAAYDNLPWGQDAATRSANRVAEQIHAA